MSGKIHFEIRKRHLGVVTIDHLPHNAMPGYLLTELAKTIRQAGEMSEVRVILLQSAGERTFCAGASFDEMATLADFESAKSFFTGFARVILALRECGKITVGRIHGKAVGGGVGLCSAVDYAVANKWASVRLSELDLGIGPFVIGPAVERKIGVSGFSELALNPSEWQTAEWAYSRGLFQELFQETSQMDAWLEGYLDRFLSYSPEALASVKRMLWENTGSWEDLLVRRAEISGRMVLQEDAQTAIRKMLAGRRKS